MLKIEVGNVITWSSAAGNLIGVVKSIQLGPNALKETCPWMIIENVKNQENSSLSNTLLCGNHNYLKSMKVRVVS